MCLCVWLVKSVLISVDSDASYICDLHKVILVMAHKMLMELLTVHLIPWFDYHPNHLLFTTVFQSIQMNDLYSKLNCKQTWLKRERKKLHIHTLRTTSTWIRNVTFYGHIKWILPHSAHLCIYIAVIRHLIGVKLLYHRFYPAGVQGKPISVQSMLWFFNRHSKWLHFKYITHFDYKINQMEQIEVKIVLTCVFFQLLEFFFSIGVR